MASGIQSHGVIEGVGRVDRTRAAQLNLVVVAVWLWSMVPPVVQRLTGPTGRASVTQEVPYTAAAAMSATVMGGLLVLTLVLVIVSAWRSLPHHPVGPLLLLLLPWIYLVLRSMAEGGGVDIRKIAYPLIVVTIWVLRPRLRDLVALGWVVVVTAALAIGFGVLIPEAGIFRKPSGEVIVTAKSDLPWGLLTGMFSHPNSLGQYLVIGLPFVTLIRRGLTRFLGVVVVVLAIVWTSSRTSEIAVVAGALVTLVCMAWSPQRRRYAVGMGLTALAGVVVVVPLVTTAYEAFTNRGYIWAVSRQFADAEPAFGLGPGWYGAIGSSAGNLGPTVFHGHNQFIHTLTTGGLVGVLIIAAYSLVAAWKAAARTRTTFLGAAFVAALFATCLFEVSYTFVDNTVLMPVVAIPLAALLVSRREDDGEWDETPPAPTAYEPFPDLPDLDLPPMDLRTITQPIRVVGAGESPATWEGDLPDPRSRPAFPGGSRLRNHRPAAPQGHR